MFESIPWSIRWSVCMLSVQLLNSRVYFDPIKHHSAGNDQFAFYTFLLTPDTDNLRSPWVVHIMVSCYNQATTKLAFYSNETSND